MRVATYPYDTGYAPPMPVLPVQLEAPGREVYPQEFMGLVDSGADGTLIPLELLEMVGARYVGEARLVSITDTRLRVDVYLINLRVGEHWVRGVRVVAPANLQEIILGRNVLTHLVVTLNGLAGVTELSA